MLSYQFLKSFHLVSLIAWMAGLFYFPRLLVYHVSYPQNSTMLAIMERRLMFGIMHPAMLFTFISGGLLLYYYGDYHVPWMHVKLTFVLALMLFQIYLNIWRKQILMHKCRHTERFFRIINEIPTLILIAIIYLVIYQPS